MASSLANLRLPRFVGERPARQAIMFGRDFRAGDEDAAGLVEFPKVPADGNVVAVAEGFCVEVEPLGFPDVALKLTQGVPRDGRVVEGV